MWIIQYLPLPVAVAQGYFKDEGLNVTVNNFDAGGSKALQALLGGSTDMVVGFFDHTIQMQVQGKEIRAVILLNQIPGVGYDRRGQGPQRANPQHPDRRGGASASPRSGHRASSRCATWLRVRA